MNKYDIWQLFKQTGKIEYYLKYKKMKEDVKKSDDKTV